ncbi:MAG: pilus assembly protein TadG-related protein [Candidatus Sulfotelmatobacter sp.]|jgi:Flp pilus assembly protein TadG
MALVAITMVAIISMAALSIDIGTLYEAKAEAQRAADAAALTAARVISISGNTGATSATWGQICGGGGSAATLAAISMAQQNLIGGVSVPSASVSVNYGAGSSGATNTDCSGLGANFAVNPVVTVSVQRTNLPIFFARVFSLFGSRYSGTTVSATATAEAFNPSGSGPMIPVQPRCVKPWMVPNQDPAHFTGTKYFVDPTSGAIKNPGTFTGNNGVIGETFDLIADCQHNPRHRCVLPSPPNSQPVAAPPPVNTLQYVPAQPPVTSVAIAANTAISGCSQILRAEYWDAVAGCDQTTAYACGTPLANMVDLAVDNPGLNGNDSVNAAQCLINATNATAFNQMTNGQDYLDPGLSPYTYPFQIKAGGNSALTNAGVASGNQITNSPSIVSLPIYDNATVISGAGTTPVTVIGFLQVFINSVDNGTGKINVTVMNVSGCGNGAANPPVYGTSPVPVRLITPP